LQNSICSVRVLALQEEFIVVAGRVDGMPAECFARQGKKWNSLSAAPDTTRAPMLCATM
jgi:hypothetical protein